jgi:deoxyribonuclease-4
MTAPHLGAHMSIAGGMPRAIERARAVAATALQVFVKSSNQWAARPFAPGEVLEYRRASQEAGLAPFTLAHASYLINLASPDDALWGKSTAALTGELDRCEELGIPWLVVHPGSHVGSGVSAGVGRVASALKRVLGGAGGGSSGVLLEITAGQGHSLGARFEELGAMIEGAGGSDRIGICFDTCHALAAGHEIRDAASYRETMRALDSAVGLSRLKAFHLNDSKGELGSRLDRHEHIGRGKVGLEAFRLILADRRFRDLPMVLETPKEDDLAEDRENLGVLRSLVSR